MNMFASELQDASWLDLCSGSGVMGCEAIERGVSRVWAVEKDPKTASICRDNLILIAGDRSSSPTIEVIRLDLVSWLQTGRPNSLPAFDFVYFDPPYGSELYEPTLLALLEGNWITSQGIVICEHARRKKLTAPTPWTVVDQRRYGKSALLLLSPPMHYPGGTDSKRQQITPSG
jgi:16S rRNA (guanine(966)-N(2))-methyltransferase RsmD